MAPEPLNVNEYERLAEERLEPATFGYYAGGAGDEWTLRENVAAFNRWVLRPRMLVDVATVSTRTTVLGQDISMPVLVAPTALHRLTHPDAELAAARAAAGADTVFCLSTISSVSPADVAAAVPDGLRWFQLYWSPDRGFTADLVGAAANAGFRVIVLTVDLPAAGRRERDFRLAFEVPEEVPLPNLPWHLSGGDLQRALTEMVNPTITWRDLEWLASLSELPIVVKGILTAEDARLACQHGVAGVIVSNHGGRQLDGVAASLDALPEVVQACADEVPVLVDGGVRRGTDVVKALALGARSVLVGRAVLWGLAVDGEAGASRVLALLRAEVELALTLLGCPSPEAVTREHVGRAAF
jgi:isopentenyl diphosphate isomerase/L-lactate dehydrogenase-like FMN-dependent dehydrogenase